MQLWGIDIVGGIELVNAVTGVGRDAKIVTGVDDHSRFCVMAAASKDSGHGPLTPQFPSPSDAHQVADQRRESPCGSQESTQSPTTGTTHFAQEASDHRSSARYRLFWITTPQATCGSQVLKHQANQGSRCASSSGNTGGGIERLV